MPLRIPRVVLRLAPGPTWKTGKPEDQPGWDEHAEFIDDLIDRGVFFMGGPWTNRLGSMSIWEGMNADEVLERDAGRPVRQERRLPDRGLRRLDGLRRRAGRVGPTQRSRRTSVWGFPSSM